MVSTESAMLNSNAVIIGNLFLILLGLLMIGTLYSIKILYDMSKTEKEIRKILNNIKIGK